MFRSVINLVLVSATLLLSMPAAFCQSFNVLILDALDGKPQASVRIDYFCEGQGWIPSNLVLTGTDGIAQVPSICGNGGQIELSAVPPGNDEYAKDECGGFGASTQQIMTNGFISDPSGAGGIWCPRRVSKRLKPVPGEVIIFVKKPTWWQVHVAG